MEMNTDENTTKISTLIFMDLETTGLPSDVGKKNVHITEMSFIAIDRDSFEEDQNMRVINKLSLCMRPRSVVSPGAMHVTGLYNDILENQEEFDDSVPKLLEYFFRRLQTPICLLAHNGKRFDFPVLQAELNRINYSLGSGILCADTLTAFRSICLSPKPAKVEPPKENGTHSKDVKSDGGPITEDEIESLLSEDLESFAHMTCVSTSDEKAIFEQGAAETNPALRNVVIENIQNKKETGLTNAFINPADNEKTPTNRKIPSNINPRDMNFKKRKILDDSTQNLKSEDKRPIKRALFPETRTTPPPKITKFTLENIYTQFFNESPPQSHYAEMDCISLSKVCQKINKEFLHWIDQNSEAFCDINALW